MLTLVTGIPASGKTTFCKDKPTFSWDSWVLVYTGIKNVEEAGIAFSKDKNGLAALADAIVAEYDGSLFVDAPIMYASLRTELVALLKKRGIQDINCIYLLCPVYLASGRNVQRGLPISREALYSAFACQEYPTTAEGFTTVNFIVSE